MTLVVVAIAACAASGLTFFSGFGLGTLLLPVMALFLPVEQAVAGTALVHFLNNLFKLMLVGRRAEKRAVLAFGLPAILFSFIGAAALFWLARVPPLLTTAVGGAEMTVTALKLIIAVLMVVFAVLEGAPRITPRAFDARFLPLGGAVSGFLGGLSGHQGAMRSAFLIRLGLGKEAFIGTGVVIACLVDAARLPVYAARLGRFDLGETGPLLTTATGAAFVGAVLGQRMLKKVTIAGVQRVVSAMLILIAALLAFGVI